jgi:hypothetical protein
VELSDPAAIRGHLDGCGGGVRLILDTHPDLACTPQTSMPALCSLACWPGNPAIADKHVRVLAGQR